MSTSQVPTPKYNIYASFEIEGVVERSDVIGAIFGQTEGLFGQDLDLRELQKSGRIGRIEIEIKSKRDKTTGTIVIPSSLDRTSTAVIAAAVESIERVGPCIARITLKKVEDVRKAKREAIIKRAKEILKKWTLESLPETDEVLEEVSATLKRAEVVSYGPERLPAGPEVGESSSIIIVEGRADVINLLRCGIKNVIAIEGVKIPESIIELSKKKEVTAFLDGDRGGNLILKELLQVADIDFVVRAPKGKEVEELSPTDIAKILLNKVPVSQIRRKKLRIKRAIAPKQVKEAVIELRGTLEAIAMDSKMRVVARIPVSELCEKLQQLDGVHTIVFDGVITQRLVDIAGNKNVKCIVGDRVSNITKRPIDLKLLRFAEISEKN